MQVATPDVSVTACSVVKCLLESFPPLSLHLASRPQGLLPLLGNGVGSLLQASKFIYLFDLLYVL